MSKKAFMAAVIITAFLFSLLTGTTNLRLTSASTANTWVTLAPMPEAKSTFGAATVNGKIYAMGGYQTTGSYGYAVTGSIYMYDPATDEWSVKKDMPTPRDQFGIAVYQNKIYVIGGRLADGTITNVNEVYDPATDNWETKAPVPIVRWGMQANVVGDKIYLISGFPGIKSPATILNDVYDPITDTWATKAPIPNAVVGYGSAVLDGKIYVVGGFNMITQLNLNQVYDTKTDTWSLSSPPPMATNGGAVASTTGLWALKRIYLIGGFLDGSTANTTQIYNPYDNTWSVAASLPTDRIRLSVAVLNDTIFAIGGNIFNNTSDANEQYIPIGYGTPDSTHQTATPPPSSTPTQTPTTSPTTTLTRAPTITPTFSPSPSPSPSPTQQPTIEPSPTASPTPIQKTGNSNFTLEIIGIVVIAVVVVGLLVYFSRREGRKQ